MLTEEQVEKGRKIRNHIVGERIAAALGKIPEGDIRRTFTNFVDEACFAWIWTRQGLGQRERSMLTLGILATLGRKEEFQIHTRGALNNGCTPEEIYEIVLHTSAYAGIPAGASALRWAREELGKSTEGNEPAR